MQYFRKLSRHENELYQRVDEVLHYLWDPIGVSGIPEARDEYHSYLDNVFRLLMHGDGEERISTYLGSISSDHMGLTGNRSCDSEVAEILVNWRENILGRDENDVQLTAEQMAELDRRIEDHKKHPDNSVSWAEVNERLRKRG